MLSIALVGTHQKQYYTNLSREDYYTEGGEPPGEFFGNGAKHLGLKGVVDKETLANLMRGFAPDGATRLVRNAGSETRRAGMDLTFNAPKSVSVAYSQASNDVRHAIQEAHAGAVKAALSYIEDSAAQVRLGRNGIEVVSAGLIVAMFEHSSARIVPGHPAPDPHLHTHALVINAGVTEDGRTGTLDSKELFRHKMAAGVLYRAELFRQLELRLGLTASRRDKFCELDAVPKELCELFSKRRKAIEEMLEEQGVSGAKHAERATLHTRTTKPTVDRARFLEEWQRVGREHGLVVDDAYIKNALAGAPVRDIQRLLEVGLQRAISKVTAQQSHFAEREFVRALADELEDKGVGADVILAGVRSYFQTPDIVSVGESKGERRYSTKEMLELERRMLGHAQDLTRRRVRVSAPTLKRVLKQKKFATITDEQREALLHITQGRALSLVRGVAGTGKTYLLSAALEAWTEEKKTVLGACLAATAAKRLEEGSGIKSSSLHRLLWEIEQGKRTLDEHTVLVIDEAAMIGTRQMAALVELAREAKAQLVLVGDDRQLQAIDAGAPFASMARRFDTKELNDIRRQKNLWARQAVHDFARGEARKAMKQFVQRGLVHVAQTRQEAVARVVELWRRAVDASGLSETLVLTGTRAEARRVNRQIQVRRRLASELGESIKVGEENFHRGDRVLFRKNSRKHGVTNGDRGEVVRVSEHGITVRLDDGTRITIHPDAADQVKPHLGYASTTHSSQGATVDRCIVLAGGSMQDREATYVQASRARVETHIVTDRLSAGEDGELGELLRDMERSRAKDLAVDLMDRERGQGQELDVA